MPVAGIPYFLVTAIIGGAPIVPSVMAFSGEGMG
jgi:hypothetical protein